MKMRNLPNEKVRHLGVLMKVLETKGHMFYKRDSPRKKNKKNRKNGTLLQLSVHTGSIMRFVCIKLPQTMGTVNKYMYN